MCPYIEDRSPPPKQVHGGRVPSEMWGGIQTPPQKLPMTGPAPQVTLKPGRPLAQTKDTYDVGTQPLTKLPTQSVQQLLNKPLAQPNTNIIPQQQPVRPVDQSVKQHPKVAQRKNAQRLIQERKIAKKIKDGISLTPYQQRIHDENRAAEPQRESFSPSEFRPQGPREESGEYRRAKAQHERDERSRFDRDERRRYQEGKEQSDFDRRRQEEADRNERERQEEQDRFDRNQEQERKERDERRKHTSEQQRATFDAKERAEAEQRRVEQEAMADQSRLEADQAEMDRQQQVADAGVKAEAKIRERKITSIDADMKAVKNRLEKAAALGELGGDDALSAQQRQDLEYQLKGMESEVESLIREGMDAEAGIGMNAPAENLMPQGTEQMPGAPPLNPWDQQSQWTQLSGAPSGTMQQPQAPPQVAESPAQMEPQRLQLAQQTAQQMGATVMELDPKTNMVVYTVNGAKVYEDGRPYGSY